MATKWYTTLLLENQLLFLVLEKLYMFTFGDSSSCNNRQEGQQIKEEDSPLFVKLCRKYFGCLSHHHEGEGQQIEEHKMDTPFVELSRDYFRRYDQKQPRALIAEEVKHFTDLLRYFFLQSNERKEEWKNSLFIAL
jgi:hypothetical protein